VRSGPRGRALPGLALALALTIALWADRAGAHQYWLAPSRYLASPHTVVEVSAAAGTGFRGEKKPWSPARCVRFVGRAARTLDFTRAATVGELAWARFAPSDDGGAMLAYESNFAQIELPAAEFDAYLEEEGLREPLETRRRAATATPGRERYRRCAKTWLAGRDSKRALQPFGLPLEIVPLRVPGDDPALRVRVLWNQHPLAGARVKAWRSDLAPDGAARDPGARDSVGMAWSGLTDAHGEAAVPLALSGEWLVSVEHMVPSGDRAEADWESTWASLTFERRAAPPR
jgi:uncharacterized GH25 family protein